MYIFVAVFIFGTWKQFVIAVVGTNGVQFDPPRVGEDVKLNAPGAAPQFITSGRKFCQAAAGGIQRRMGQLHLAKVEHIRCACGEQKLRLFPETRKIFQFPLFISF